MSLYSSLKKAGDFTGAVIFHAHSARRKFKSCRNTTKQIVATLLFVFQTLVLKLGRSQWHYWQLRAILEDLDFSIKANEIHALLRSNRTGKSILAQLIMGCTSYTPRTVQKLIATLHPDNNI